LFGTALELNSFRCVSLQVNGLYVDGIAGKDTQRKLFSSNAVPNNL
jgi:hypothetical protein